MLSIKAKIEQVGLGFLHFIYLFYTFQQRFGSRKAKFAVNSVIVLNEANKGKDSPSFYGNLMLNQWKTISDNFRKFLFLKPVTLCFTYKTDLTEGYIILLESIWSRFSLVFHKTVRIKTGYFYKAPSIKSVYFVFRLLLLFQNNRFTTNLFIS